MSSKINVVIPSIQLSRELIYCLEQLNNQTYKNFFVTIVLDFKNKTKRPKLKFKLNILISKKKNMLCARIFKREKFVQRFYKKP